jgi:hypothetical protein
VRSAITRGLLFGAVGLHLAVVGVLLMLHQRWIVVGTISLGQAVMVLLAVGAGLMAIPGAIPGTGAAGNRPATVCCRGWSPERRRACRWRR